MIEPAARAGMLPSIRHILRDSAVPEEIDREAFEAAWRARMDRSLPSGCKLDLSRRESSFGKVVTLTISTVPSQFAQRIWCEFDVCPVCGQLTSGQTRVKAALD